MAATETYKDIENLKATGKQYDVRWLPVKGLYLRVSPSGSKCWLVRGNLKKEPMAYFLKLDYGSKLSSVEEEARDARAKIKKGIDPRVTVAPPRDLLLEDVWPEFYEKHVLKKNGTKHQECQLDIWTRLVEPIHAKTPVKSVDTVVVNNFIDMVEKQNGVAMANKVISWFSTMWTEMNRYHPVEMPTNPCWSRKKATRPSKDRHLGENEFRAWGEAWKKCPREDKYMLLFQLLTGCRDGVHIDYDPKWRVKPEYLKFPKGVEGLKGAKFLCIPTPARPLIERFVKTDYFHLNRTCKWISRTAGIKHFAPHDLRRTFSTWGVIAGETIEHMNTALGHSHGQINDIYIIASIRPLQPVVERVGAYLMGLLGLTPADL